MKSYKLNIIQYLVLILGILFFIISIYLGIYFKFKYFPISFFIIILSFMLIPIILGHYAARKISKLNFENKKNRKKTIIGLYLCYISIFILLFQVVYTSLLPFNYKIDVELIDTPNNKITPEILQQTKKALSKRMDKYGVLFKIEEINYNIINIKLRYEEEPEVEMLRKFIEGNSSLSFHLVHKDNDSLIKNISDTNFILPEGFKCIKTYKGNQTVIVKTNPELVDNVEEADANTDPQTNLQIVNVTFLPEGKERFAKITENNIGQRLAIILDSVVYSAPIINGPIKGGQIQISGMENYQEAKLLEIVLNSTLPCKIKITGLYNIE